MIGNVISVAITILQEEINATDVKKINQSALVQNLMKKMIDDRLLGEKILLLKNIKCIKGKKK